jgi:hypothetical protein
MTLLLVQRCESSDSVHECKPKSFSPKRYTILKTQSDKLEWHQRMTKFSSQQRGKWKILFNFSMRLR